MVTVIGLGFVGLTTALSFAESGQSVYGIEADPERFETIKSGRLPFLEPGLGEALTKHLGKGFILSSDWGEAIGGSDVVYYCVGTPYGEDGQADLSILFNAVRQTIAAVHDDRFRVLVIKSTIPPSTTKERIIPFLEQCGMDVPGKIGVANNPEFLREGHCWEDVIHADRIVLGVEDKRSEEILRNLYKKSDIPLYCVSYNTGEFIKYLSNTSLACLISYANEMSLAADAIGGIDTADAFRILHLDKRWQSGSIRSYFYPGCGYGGYCLPKDTSAFYALSKAAGFGGPMLKSIIETNDSMPMVTAGRIMQAAENDTSKRIGILGLSFNAGSSDTRDTPSAKIIAGLNKLGFTDIIAYDPAATEEFRKNYSVQAEYAATYDEAVDRADVIAIVTAWPEFKDIRTRTGKPVVDCRYVL